MKKTSTLIMSLLLTAGAWCGIAYAADAEPSEGSQSEAKTVVFDFVTNGYGLTGTNSNSTPNEIKSFTAEEGAITISLVPTDKTSSGLRWWITDADKQEHDLRAYTGTQLVVSITDGAIEEISVETTRGIDNLTVADFTKTTDGNNATFSADKTDATSATLTCGAQVRFTSITVKYTGGVEDTREPIKISTNAKKSYTVELGSAFYSPYFYSTEYYDAVFTYTSSNPDVATVNKEGDVTLVAVGTTVITASVEATDKYKANTASYVLNVVPEGCLLSSAKGEEFTLENPAALEVWKHDTQYNCLKATTYGADDTAAEALAVSPEMGIPAGYAATLDFDQWANYLNNAPVADHFQVLVKVLGDYEQEEQGGYYDGETEGETEGEGETAEPEWTVLTDAVETPTNKWTANKTISLSAYSGKIIQIAFKYIATADVVPTWEVKNILVMSIDPLKAEKDAAIAELTKYFDHIPGDHSWDLANYGEMIKEATTAEEVTETLELILGQLASQYANNLEVNFYFSVGEKFGAYVKPETEGVNPWQVVDELAANGVFAGKRVNERSWMPWSAKAADDETEIETGDRESNNEDAMMIYNVQTGYYLGQPTAAGEAIPVVEEEAEAGYWYVKATEGQFVIVDDANDELFLFWDDTKGLIASEVAATFPVDEIPVWDNGYCDYYVSIDVPTTGTDDWGRPVAEEINEFDVYVSTAATLTGIGGIQCYTFDNRTDERITLVNITAAQLAEITPEKATGIYKKTVGWSATGPVYEEIEFEANRYHVTIKNDIMGRAEGDEEGETGITTPGDYYFETLEGTWIVSDEKEGKLFSPEVHEQVSILGEVEPGEGFGFESDPVSGTTVDEISSIIICPENDYCTIVWTNPAGTNIVFSAGETVIKTWTPDEVLLCAIEKEDEWNDPDLFEFNLEETITAAGTYSLYIPEGFFEDETGKNAETILTWTIEGEDGITSVTVKGDAISIYDLQGRRVNAASKGIFIINGKKVLVK